jgi:hypothetical protein
MIDDHAAVVEIDQAGQWQNVVLTAADFRNLAGESLPNWENIRQLKLSDAERLRPARGETTKSRIVGKNWLGPAPEFRQLRWVTETDNE